MDRETFLFFLFFIISEIFSVSNSAEMSSNGELKSIDASERIKLVNLDFCNSKEAIIDIQDISSGDSVKYSITVEPGTTITVNIKGNPTTGYSQRMTTKPEETIVKVVGTEPNYVPVPHEEMMVGYGGIYVFKYLAIKPGTTSSTIEYARYFEIPHRCIFKTEIQFKVVDHCGEQILKE
ncbi:cysteine protease inhibitor [Cryptosporidium ubiquitum]|uniref:Cysteine protease inhibitor n=1 Tax=Cryptosporidium ubiquitum TaxID=857276 RepID=A0A1J4MJ84_9CRYT|nr:cysteine protease inhibitor [Cryptosporidium ubiquitum]OII73084.1 cysteine protease inhibitor [Cryptosporidium ubiquitum]